MSNSCVITNEEGWYKKALDTDLARPKICDHESGDHIYLARLSDTVRMCRYHDAYNGTLFCIRRYNGDHRQDRSGRYEKMS